MALKVLKENILSKYIEMFPDAVEDGVDCVRVILKNHLDRNNQEVEKDGGPISAKKPRLDNDGFCANGAGDVVAENAAISLRSVNGASDAIIDEATEALAIDAGAGDGSRVPGDASAFADLKDFSKHSEEAESTNYQPIDWQGYLDGWQSYFEVARRALLSIFRRRVNNEHLILCDCCLSDVPFEMMIHCMEGHLYCKECVKRCAEESIYGEGRASLECLGSDCDQKFPEDQLRSVLSPEMMEKLDERLKVEWLNLAKIEDLVKCPFCTNAAILPAERKVFPCDNPSCGRLSCRVCGAPWSEHVGKECREVERLSDTRHRTSVEEQMTAIKIRRCPRCETSFTKSSGCNRMTCRCGGTLCYICRAPDIDYAHFCGHPRDPDRACDQCSLCSMWTNPDQDENLAADDLRQKGEAERFKQFSGSRAIGVSLGPRRQRRHCRNRKRRAEE